MRSNKMLPGKQVPLFNLADCPFKELLEENR